MKKLILLLVMFFFLSSVSALCSSGQVDVNSASLEELDQLYGIGPAKAQAIIDARPYNNLDDLTDAHGIGEVTLSNIKSRGIACVNDEDEESENLDESFIEKVIVGTEENKKQPLKTNAENRVVELETISLNSEEGKEKDIKIDNVSESQEKDGYAVYGFVAFSVLIVFLFGFKAWKNKYKYKNEFDKIDNGNG